jgi:hypothetical protein
MIALLVLVSAVDPASDLCNLAGAGPVVDLNVGRVPGADRACIDETCADVEAGIARLEWMDPDALAAWREMNFVDVRILGAGRTVLSLDQVSIPRSYPNGRDCGTDGPSGSMILRESGEISQRQ